MDFSFLRAEPFELPDPQALAIRGMTLANLSQTNQEGQMKLDALRRAQEGQAALSQVLPALQAAGYSKEAIAQALQANPTAAPYLIDYLNKKRKEDQDYEKTGAEIADKRAAAAKTDTDRKLAIADKFGNEAAWLADHPNLTPAMVADYQKRVAAAGLQDVLRVVPFEDWTDPNKAREALKANSMQFYDIKDRIAAQETGRHNIATEGIQQGTLQETGRHNLSTEGIQRGTLAKEWASLGETKANNLRVDERTREATAATRDATKNQRLDTETQSLAKFVDSNALPNLITSANALDATIQKYSKVNDIPGVGIADANMPPILRSTEGNKVRAQIQAVANDLLKLYSGGAVTANEAERRATEMMASGQFNEDDLRNAWPLVKGRINAAVQNVRGGYSPEAINTYEGRGGIKIAPIGSSNGWGKVQRVGQ